MQKIPNLFGRKQNMQQQKYSPWTTSQKQQILHSAPCKHRLCRKSWTCSTENRICSSRNTAMDIHHRNSNKYYTQPPWKHRLCRKSWTYSIENRICSNRNTAHGHTSQKQQQIHCFSLGSNRCIVFLWVWYFKFVLRVFVF